VRAFAGCEVPMKRFIIVIGIIAVSLTGLTIFKNLIIKSVVTTVASRITGAPVHMDRFSLNIFRSTINISGFKMYNPSGFPEGILVDCPQIKVIYDNTTLFKHKRHFLLVEIELKEMGLTTNKDGKLNVDSLKISRESASSPDIPMQIDLVTLSMGRIVHKDYTAGKEPIIRVHEVNRHNSYKGIPTAKQFAFLVLSEPLKAAAINDAAILGAAIVSSFTAVPVAVAATLIGKDYVQQVINAGFEDLYKVSLEVIKRMGKITKEDEPNGVIKADINGAMIALILRKEEENKIQITISARKFMFPKLQIAGGVLYQILDKLQYGGQVE
jgi:hypothetical protein